MSTKTKMRVSLIVYLHALNLYTNIHNDRPNYVCVSFVYICNVKIRTIDNKLNAFNVSLFFVFSSYITWRFNKHNRIFMHVCFFITDCFAGDFVGRGKPINVNFPSKGRCVYKVKCSIKLNVILYYVTECSSNHSSVFSVGKCVYAIASWSAYVIFFLCMIYQFSLYKHVIFFCLENNILFWLILFIVYFTP